MLISRFKPFFRLYERMGLKLPPPANTRRTFWLHAASVGEMRSLKHLVEILRSKYPEHGIILSTMTEGGYNTAIREIQPDAVFLLPIENYFAIKTIIRRYRVDILFITDTELWPNLIISASGEIDVVMLNARISDKTIKTYNRFRILFAPLMRRLKCIITKSETDAERFSGIIGHNNNVIVGGNIKFFMADDISDNRDTGITGRVAFAASTHKPEEELFLKAALATEKSFDHIVLAPRHISRAGEVLATARTLGFDAGLYSENTKNKVIVVDELGLLEPIYKISSKIFVGGSIADIGGHNIFEALQYGKPVAVGENTYNFNDIVPLAASYGVTTVLHSQDDLCAWLSSTEQASDFEPFFKYIRDNQEKYFNIILGCINKCIGY